MRNIFMVATALSLVTNQIHAAELTQKDAAVPSPAEAAANPPSPPHASPQAASLTSPDEIVASGDLISVDRRFDNWLLRCDVRLSQNRRLCSINQQIDDGERGRLIWRIAQNTENKPVLLISAPASLRHAKGMRLSFGGLEKTIPEKDWLCSERRCQSGFRFEGFLQLAIVNADLMHFSYWVASADGREQEVSTSGSMKGFSDALKAAAGDPFGRDVTVNSAGAKKQNEGNKK